MAVDSIAATGEPQLTGDVTVSAGTGITLTQTGQDIEVAVSETALDRYIAKVLSNSPVAYYPMDDSSGLPQDISGNNLDMTAVSGTPVYQQAGPFGAGSIELAIQYPSTAYHERAAVSTAVANLTVEMWIRRSGNSSGDLFRHGTTSGGFEIEFTNTSGAYRLNLPGVGTLGGINPNLPDNTWVYLVVFREAANWTSYTNAANAGTLGSAAPGVPVGNTRIVGAGATSLRVAHLAYYDSVLSFNDIIGRYLIATGEV